MNILFMGSAQFACPAVEALLGSRHRLIACVTQPDRPKGRSLKVSPCPVKALAEARGVAVLTPEKIGDAYGALAALAPDLTVVAAYGQYIPGRILDLPRLGSINIHPSLLPRYRGAAPIQWAVASGDTETGVTILHVSRAMDAGDIILQERSAIGVDETAAVLEPRLAAHGAALLLRAIDLLESGTAPRIPQDPALATHARKLTKEDGLLDWREPAAVLRHRVRGFQPWPGCHTFDRGQRLKVLSVRVEEARGEPGTLLDAGGDGPMIACGEGALRLLEVQPEGRRPVAGTAFLAGAGWQRGDRLA